jgi:Ca2+-binding EF-hand superfamily protein
LDEVRESIG